MAFNHFVIDATGAGIILELLSESCRSQSSAELDESPNERAPVQERYFRELILNMACSDSEAYHEDSFNRSFGTPSSSQFRKDLLERMSTPSRNLSEEYITFSAKKIDQLKKACNYVLAWVRETATEMPQVDVPLPSFVSTNNVLTALLWGMIIKARHGSGASSKQNEQQHQDYDCTMAINLRSFFDPPLPVRYMGNTTTALRLTVKSTDLLRNPTVIAKDLDVQVSSRFGVDLYSLLPIAYTSYRIRDHLSRIDDTYVRSLIAFFKSHKDWNTMKFSPADIMITSVRHLKVYELDFGQSLGYIVSFSNQRSLVGNLCLIMPASVPISRAASTEERNDCPPWEVRVTLDETTMDNLKRDSLLRWALES
jgi:fumigaclavine B O-acetyltransferase